MEARPRGKFDYRKFLKRFAVPREEVELDTESFDYIFYNLGMERYGNTPLIEPLEYKEVNRLEELVIAIDTSSSCSSETVRGFLGETYRILEEKEKQLRLAVEEQNFELAVVLRDEIKAMKEETDHE